MAQYGQVIAQRFATGSGRNHHQILTGSYQIERFSLVGIQLPNAAFGKCLGQFFGNLWGNRCELTRFCRLMVDGSDGGIAIAHSFSEMVESPFNPRRTAKCLFDGFSRRDGIGRRIARRVWKT